MTDLLLAVMAQARHARAVHSCICELLMVAMPDLVKGSRYIRNSTEFCERIDCAIRDASMPNATADDYIRAIVNASCDEMETVCRLLKSASALVGIERIAADYLDGQRFREMLLRKDSEKLERIVAIVKAREGKPIKILMDVAKVLNDSAGIYDEMEASAKRRASAELKKVVENVTSIVTGVETRLGEKIGEVGGKVEAVGKKVDRIRVRRRRKSKYTDAQLEACRAYLSAAQTNVEVKHTINTRITYESVFSYYARQLAKIGVESVGTFRAIIHSAQNRECEDRKRALEAKREAERTAKRKPKPRSGR